jgi:hypothetical protein
MPELKLRRFRCYHGTIKKPCTVDLRAIDEAILGHALEHVREAHPRFARVTPDLEAQLRDEIEDDVLYHPVGSGPVRFVCQDLCPPGLWRCEFMVYGATISACVKAALAHFAAAHPRLAPDEEALRGSVRSADARKGSWAWTETPLHERWRRRR